MKKALLSLPVLTLVRRALPGRKKPGIGSLLALRFIPGWALTAFAVAFIWSAFFRSKGSSDVEYPAESF